MTLFNNEKTVNILPEDGVAIYHGKVIQQPEADNFFSALLKTIVWKNDEAFIFGKHILTKRKVAWYGDSDYQYTYSNTTKRALPWTPELAKIKVITEKLTGDFFNSCLLNLYHNGTEGMAWHSDDESSLEKKSAIASLSFGAERKFAFKHKKTGQSLKILLEHGSLLLMKGNTQANWLHSLPKSARIITPRINLTFRTMVT